MLFEHRPIAFGHRRHKRHKKHKSDKSAATCFVNGSPSEMGLDSSMASFLLTDFVLYGPFVAKPLVQRGFICDASYLGPSFSDTKDEICNKLRVNGEPMCS
jgi:hypothetical protein